MVKISDNLKVKTAQGQSIEKPPSKNLNFKGPPEKQRNFSSVGSRQQIQWRRSFQPRSQATPRGKENREQSNNDRCAVEKIEVKVIAGNLRRFKAEWSKMISDQSILQTI